MIVYLGAAIDTSLGTPSEQFDALAKLVLRGAGDGASVVFFNPLTAFVNAAKATAKTDMQFIIDTNNAALDASELAVFSWTTSPSYGVPLEIQRRKDKGGPMLIWNRTDKKLGIYLRCGLSESQRIVHSEAELLEAVANFQSRRLPEAASRGSLFDSPTPIAKSNLKNPFVRTNPLKIGTEHEGASGNN